MIKFTVVTITYNAEAVLGRTLQSVLQQTHTDVEHLIIDGASTDGTLALVLYNATDKELNIHVADGNHRYPLYVPRRAVVSLLMNTDLVSHVISPCASPSDATYYTLNGCRVDYPSQPGIYVRQGRKEIIQ